MKVGHTPHLESGFTIIEIIITIVLVGLVMLPVFGSIFRYYMDVASTNRHTVMSIESQSASRKIADDLRMASGIMTSNSIADPHRSGGWITSSANHILVISTPAQNNSLNFIIDPSTSKPYRNEIVYYNSGESFYRRTLPNSNASGNAMIRSCPPASVTSSCPADTKLTEKFDTSTFTFYDTSNNATGSATSARSVKVSLTLKGINHGQPTSISNSIRVTFRNT